jgi:hypothetical protein
MPLERGTTVLVSTLAAPAAPNCCPQQRQRPRGTHRAAVAAAASPAQAAGTRRWHCMQPLRTVHEQAASDLRSSSRCGTRCGSLHARGGGGGAGAAPELPLLSQLSNGRTKHGQCQMGVALTSGPGLAANGTGRASWRRGHRRRKGAAAGACSTETAASQQPGSRMGWDQACQAVVMYGLQAASRIPREPGLTSLPGDGSRVRIAGACGLGSRARSTTR